MNFLRRFGNHLRKPVSNVLNNVSRRNFVTHDVQLFNISKRTGIIILGTAVTSLTAYHLYCVHNDKKLTKRIWYEYDGGASPPSRMLCRWI